MAHHFPVLHRHIRGRRGQWTSSHSCYPGCAPNLPSLGPRRGLSVKAANMDWLQCSPLPHNALLGRALQAAYDNRS